METIATKKVDAAELEQKVKKMYSDVIFQLLIDEYEKPVA